MRVAWRIIREVLGLLGAVVGVLALLALMLYGTLAELEPGELLGVIPEFVFGFIGVALGVWGLFVALGATLLRRRGPWWRIGTHVLAAPIAGVVNVFVVSAIGDALDAQGGFVATIALLGSAVFVPVAILATPVVVLLLDRLGPQRPVSSPPPSVTSDPAGGR